MTQIEKALQNATDTKALLIGNNVLGKVPEIFSQQFPGKKAVVVADINTFIAAGKQVILELQNAKIEQLQSLIITDPNLYAEYNFVDALVKFLKSNDAIPIAVGSGTINDLIKLSSFLAGRRYMTVATAASMDGYASYGASITKNGAKQTFSCPAPQAIVADINVISKAPSSMTAAGYADLFAKVTAGADWILADSLGIEPINNNVWDTVQNGLHSALANPEGAKNGDPEAITQLIEGLMLSGFAMQQAQSSRPASGAEHQFSHLWNMEHHTNNGQHISHGFQVSIGMLAVTAMYEQALATPFDKLDIDKCVSQYPTQKEIEKNAMRMFFDTDFPTIGVTETGAKAVTPDELRKQLQTLKDNWAEIKTRLKKQLIAYNTARERLQLVGAPTNSEEIGITHERLREAYIRAQYIRRRFTILDLAVRTGNMNSWLNNIFDK